MDLDKLKRQLQVEVDTSFLYKSISDIQTDEALANILKSLSEIEQSHANRILEKIRLTDINYKMPRESLRARIQLKTGKIFGYGSIITSLTTVEKAVAENAIKKKIQEGEKLSGFEHNHLEIIEAISKNKNLNISGGLLSKFESRHKTVGGNALRASVLGANDGLVSNMSLVMGVVGASASSKTIILTGIAGLLAGAISMALGEWLSVQSSRELHLHQIALETEELENSPEDEKKELILLYKAKGMDEEVAEKLAEKIFENKETALDALITEELGIDKEELGGSAWEAAFASFFLFSIGAIIPVFPFFLYQGNTAIIVSLIASIIGLFFIGAAITLYTGKSVLFSGLRQVIFGLIAAAVTYGVGSLIGVTIGG